jgi:endo-1,4-beta-xylanase
MEAIAKYFNYYTISVSFSMVERTRGKFDFTVADRIVEFAIKQHGKVKGHSLVLVGAIPDWVEQGNFSADTLKEILKTHVQTIVKHFKDKYPGAVDSWQVVNESVCNGNIPVDCPKGIKNVVWTNIHKAGSTDERDYIALAFEWAHQADPEAKLYLNEDGNEYDVHPKKQRIFDLLTWLVTNNVPIDGVGMEAHLRLYYSPKITVAGLLATIKSYAALGLETQITETDVLLSRGYEPNSLPTKPIPVIKPVAADYQEQANLYATLLNACIKSKNCTAFTTGATYDGASWTKNYWPENSYYDQILDTAVKPKQAYYTMLAAAN